jgi:hypothetical protein
VLINDNQYARNVSKVFRSFIMIKDISSSECQKEKGTLIEFYSFLDDRTMKRS